MLVSVGCPPALAEESASPPRFELTPFSAYRFGGEFEGTDGERDFAIDEHGATGLIFDIRSASMSGQWEVLYAHQVTALETAPAFTTGRRLALDVDYWHFGGTYLFDGAEVRPFIGATVGAVHFEPGLPEFTAETYLSASLGGGVQLRADRRVGVRLEGRVYASFLDTDGEIFCPGTNAIGPCAVAVESELLVQWEVRAGLVWRFR